MKRDFKKSVKFILKVKKVKWQSFLIESKSYYSFDMIGIIRVSNEPIRALTYRAQARLEAREPTLDLVSLSLSSISST